MILAAGRGERMRPLTDKIPKAMLEINGKPLIAYHVEHLAQAGIVDIVINHAIFGEQIEAYLGDGDQWGVRIRYSPESDQPLETAGGIRQALPLLGKAPFLVINADIWTDFPFRQLTEPQADRVGLAHLVLTSNPVHNKQGDFALAKGWVKNAGKPMFTFSGIGVYQPEFFMDCPSGVVPLVPMLRQAAARQQVSGEYYAGEWFDIGTPERLHMLRRMQEK